MKFHFFFKKRRHVEVLLDSPHLIIDKIPERVFKKRFFLRGRDIFGPPDFIAFLNDGAPVWRAGANLTTRLITELPLVINETRLEPGEYTMFIQLGPERWILIISEWPAQERYDYHDREALFGAYGYTPDKDVLRTDMTLQQPLPMSFEQLSWQFLDVTPEGGRLALIWDKQMASVPFQIAPPQAGEADE